MADISKRNKANKAKGAAAEKAVVEYLNRWWPLAERRRLTGAWDKGDISGIPGTVLEVKNEKTIRLAQYMKELDVEMANAKADIGAVIVKKRGTSDVGEWYAVMPVRELIHLYRIYHDV